VGQHQSWERLEHIGSACAVKVPLLGAWTSIRLSDGYSKQDVAAPVIAQLRMRLHLEMHAKWQVKPESGKFDSSDAAEAASAATGRHGDEDATDPDSTIDVDERGGSTGLSRLVLSASSPGSTVAGKASIAGEKHLLRLAAAALVVVRSRGGETAAGGIA